MFIVCQFAMLNFLSIMQALKMGSPNVKHIILLQTDRNMQFCYTYCYKLVRRRYIILKDILVKSNKSILGFVYHSVFQSSPPFSNTLHYGGDVVYSAKFTIQWLQILGDNIFLTLEWQFPVVFYIRFTVGLTPITNISTGIKCSNKLILHYSGCSITGWP